MRFRASKECVAELAVNAMNASKPAGRGHAVYDPKDEATRKDVAFTKNWAGEYVYIDYWKGRSVKFMARMVEKGGWGLKPLWDLKVSPLPRDHTWLDHYKTVEGLLDSLGIKELRP